MPNYGSILTAIPHGETLALFNAESPTAPQASMAVQINSPVPAGIQFTIEFATAPTAVVYIQGANRDVEADYITLNTSTNKLQDYYWDNGGFAFYRAKLFTYSAGGALTVIARVA